MLGAESKIPRFTHFLNQDFFYINAFARMSHFDTGVFVSANDRVLTLSTCYNARVDYRIALHARLIIETFPHLEGGIP